MGLKFKRIKQKRSNPYSYSVSTKTEDEETKNISRSLSVKNNLQLKRKKRSYEDLDGECDKGLPTNKKLSKIKVFLSEDENSQDIDNEHMMDEVDNVKYDLESSPLHSDQADDNVHDINHLPIHIPPIEMKKWTQDGQDINSGHEMDETDSFKHDVESESSRSDQSENNIYDIKQSPHLPIQIPPTEKKKWPQKPCIQCRKCGTRRDTRYICSSCKIALCKSPCFSEYHSCKL